MESFQFQLNEDKSAVTFTTSHFSTYGVVYKSAAKIEEKKGEKKLPSTGQSISIATMVGGVLLTVFLDLATTSKNVEPIKRYSL